MTGSAVMDRAVARNRAKTSGSAPASRPRAWGASRRQQSQGERDHYAHDAHFERYFLPPDGRDHPDARDQRNRTMWVAMASSATALGPWAEQRLGNPPYQVPKTVGPGDPGQEFARPRADAAAQLTEERATSNRVPKETSASGCARSCVPLSLLFDWRRTPLRKCAPVKQSTKGALNRPREGTPPPCACGTRFTGRVATPPV